MGCRAKDVGLGIAGLIDFLREELLVPAQGG